MKPEIWRLWGTFAGWLILSLGRPYTIRPILCWQLAYLEAIIVAAIAGVEDIAVKIAPNKFAINARQTVYTDAIAIVRGSRNILKVSGASVKMIEDTDTFTRKISVFIIPKRKRITLINQ